MTLEARETLLVGHPAGENDGKKVPGPLFGVGDFFFGVAPGWGDSLLDGKQPNPAIPFSEGGITAQSRQGPLGCVGAKKDETAVYRTVTYVVWRGGLFKLMG